MAIMLFDYFRFIVSFETVATSIFRFTSKLNRFQILTDNRTVSLMPGF